MKRSEMKVYFSDTSGIAGKPAEDEGLPSDYRWLTNDDVEKWIKLKGRFFRDERKDEDCFFCVDKGKALYEGRFGEGDRVYVTAAYSYRRNIKKHMKESNAIMFDDDLPKADEKPE